MQCSWAPTGPAAQWTCRGPPIDEHQPAMAREGPWRSFTQSAQEQRQWQAERDYAFAEQACDNPGTMAQLLRESGQALENLQFYTQRKTIVFLFWGLEVAWIVYMFVAASIELFSFCPFEMGIMPHCDRCFSSYFLAWIGIHVGAWILDLYVYVLLVSRGFRFSPLRPMRCLPDSAKSGIPKAPVVFFLAMNTFLLLWGILGFFVVIASNRCAAGGRIYQTVPRSPLMFYSIFLAQFITPVLFFFGRRALLPTGEGARKGLVQKQPPSQAGPGPHEGQLALGN